MASNICLSGHIFTTLWPDDLHLYEVQPLIFKVWTSYLLKISHGCLICCDCSCSKIFVDFFPTLHHQCTDKWVLMMTAAPKINMQHKLLLPYTCIHAHVHTHTHTRVEKLLKWSKSSHGHRCRLESKNILKKWNQNESRDLCIMYANKIMAPRTKNRLCNSDTKIFESFKQQADPGTQVKPDAVAAVAVGDFNHAAKP